MTLSKRKSSAKVLMRRSTRRKVYWTVSMDLYLARDSFMAGVECGDHCQCGDHCLGTTASVVLSQGKAAR